MKRGVIAELGEREGGAIEVRDGRFGVYLKWKTVNAKLPAEYLDNPAEVPLELAWASIEQKTADGPSKGRSRAKASKTSKSSHSLSLPPPPKRSLSSYLHFCAEKRPEVSKTAKTLGDVSKELARLWAETSDRSAYVSLAASGKEAYEKVKAEWDAECKEIKKKAGATAKTRSGKDTRIKTSSASAASTSVKRTPSAYMLFCSANREKAVDKDGKKLSFGDTAKCLAEMWKACGEKDKEKFKALAEQAKVEQQQNNQ
jgi:hypothetical protein